MDDGTKYWCDNRGKNHNDDNGFPAIIFVSGSKYWYIDGVKYTEKEFLQFKIKNYIVHE